MDRKQIRAWMMYDWANSAFATSVMAAVLPVYYSTVAARGLGESLAVAYWGYTQTAALLIVAVLAPILGAMADYSGAKKRMLIFFALFGVAATAGLTFIGEGDYIAASLITVIATIGFSGANVFYDAFLPEVAPPGEIDQVSSKGFVYGYIGGGLLLLIDVIMIIKWDLFFPNKVIATQLTFLSVAVWWFIFMLPFMFRVKERPPFRTEPANASTVKMGFSRIKKTFKNMSHYKELMKFLFAFWLFNDGISTIIKMATIYGSSIGIGTNDLIAALLITQFVAIPCTLVISRLTLPFGPKKVLMGTLFMYILIVGLGYFMTTALHFYLLAVLVGTVQGGAQALSRSIFGSMVPEHKLAEFFGFYNISGKFSAIFGPFVFALTIQLSGSSRIGILSLIIFFIVGLVLLKRVDVEKGRDEAKTVLSPPAV